jgi:hypothetical protein
MRKVILGVFLFAGCGTATSLAPTTQPEPVGQLPTPHSNCFPAGETHGFSNALTPFLRPNEYVEEMKSLGPDLVEVMLRRGKERRTLRFERIDNIWRKSPPALPSDFPN